MQVGDASKGRSDERRSLGFGREASLSDRKRGNKSATCSRDQRKNWGELDEELTSTESWWTDATENQACQYSARGWVKRRWIDFVVAPPVGERAERQTGKAEVRTERERAGTRGREVVRHLHSLDRGEGDEDDKPELRGGGGGR